MASIISHAVAGIAAGAWTGPAPASRRFWIASGVCGAIPDIDVIGWPLKIPNSSIIGHRALTHSIAAAVVFGGIAALLTTWGDQGRASRVRLWIALTLSTVTHSLLDALTTYSVGVEFFAPFSQRRYRFPWRPLTDVIDGPAQAITNELFWVLIPVSFLALCGWFVRHKKIQTAGAEGRRQRV